MGEEVSLSYQENLHNLYQEWFIQKKEIPDDLAQVPILIIDATQNFKDDQIIQQQCVNKVKALRGTVSYPRIIHEKQLARDWLFGRLASFCS